eukprot:4920890-Ditylum_brightwellii.AAC.1
MPDNIRCCIENLKEPIMEKPSLTTIEMQHGDADGKLDDSIATICMSKAIDMYLKRRETFEENKSNMFVVIRGQCTDLVISKLESETAWMTTEAKNNVVELLKMMKDIAYKYETQSYPFKTVHNAIQSFCLLYQKDSYTLEQCLESFLNKVDVIKHSCGNIGEYAKLVEYIRQQEGNASSLDSAIVKWSVTQATEAYFAYTFISGANGKNYAKLLEDLSNAYLSGKDEYPKTLAGAHKLLTSWENHATSHPGSSNDGIVFTTEAYEGEAYEGDTVRF